MHNFDTNATTDFATFSQLYANTIHDSPIAVLSNSNTVTLKEKPVLPMTSSSGRWFLTSFLSKRVYRDLRKYNLMASSNKIYI